MTMTRLESNRAISDPLQELQLSKLRRVGSHLGYCTNLKYEESTLWKFQEQDDTVDTMHVCCLMLFLYMSMFVICMTFCRFPIFESPIAEDDCIDLLHAATEGPYAGMPLGLDLAIDVIDFRTMCYTAWLYSVIPCFFCPCSCRRSCVDMIFIVHLCTYILMSHIYRYMYRTRGFPSRGPAQVSIARCGRSSES